MCTNDWLPIMGNTPPDEDLESARNLPLHHSSPELPTASRQHCFCEPRNAQTKQLASCLSSVKYAKGLTTVKVAEKNPGCRIPHTLYLLVSVNKSEHGKSHLQAMHLQDTSKTRSPIFSNGAFGARSQHDLVRTGGSYGQKCFLVSSSVIRGTICGEDPPSP